MKVFTGRVVSTKLEKTAAVEVERTVAHPLYKKTLKKVKKYLVHDEMGAKEGQMVRFVACAPISKRKKWKVIEVLELRLPIIKKTDVTAKVAKPKKKGSK